jgi:nucleoside-diphosphate-sugar epimerase
MNTTTPRPILALYGADKMTGHYVPQVFAPEFEIKDAKNVDECDVLFLSHEAQESDHNWEIGQAALEVILDKWNSRPPKQLIYISSVEVYGKVDGENLDETENTWAKTATGLHCIRTESALEQWCRDHAVTLTILRPAMMFGYGVAGEAAEMFDQVMRGSYINIRDHAPLRSLVMAYDVVRVAKAIYPQGGIYNVTDGLQHTLPQLALAMGQNSGKNKKCFYLTYKWAKILGKIGDILPFIGILLDSYKLQSRTNSLTYSNAKLVAALPSDFQFFNTLEVIARTNKDYPYEDS